VRAILTREGLTYAQAGDRIGRDASIVWRMAKGRSVSAETLRRFALAFGESPGEWIALGRPELAEAVSEVSAPYAPRPSTAGVPVIGTVKADQVERPEEDPGEFFPAVEEHARQADAGVVRIEGHSMAPELKPGDLAGISRRKSPMRGAIVLAKRGETLYLKRLARRSGRTIRLESDNPAYDPIEGDDIELLGVVVWSHRQHV